MFTQEDSLNKFAIVSTFNDPDDKTIKYEKYKKDLEEKALILQKQFKTNFANTALKGTIDASRIWPLSLYDPGVPRDQDSEEDDDEYRCYVKKHERTKSFINDRFREVYSQMI